MELLIAALAWLIMGIGLTALIVALIQLMRSSGDDASHQSSTADQTAPHPAASCDSKHT